MKRILSFILVMGLLLTGCTAGGGDSTDQMKLNFYYCVEGTDQLTSTLAVEPEQRDVTFYTLAQLLEVYLAGPSSDHLRSPFPDGTKMLSIQEGEEGLEITMSGGFFTLQGIELSIESYCLGRTVCEYLDLEHVVVVDEMGSIRMEIAPDNYLLENSFSSENATVFTLYFPDRSHRYLTPETREVTLSENESPETYLLRQLIQGPQEGALVSPIPKDAQVLDVNTENGVCRVDLSQEFFAEYDADPYGAYSAIYSLVNTLTSLEHIDSVQLLCQGDLVEKCSVFAVGAPINRYSGSVGLIRASGTELDINVYVQENGGKGVFGVPVRVKQTIAQPLAEAVARTVVSFEAPQGFYNPIPYGTELLGISMSGNVCYVDLSRDFIPSEDTEMAEKGAVWALVTSLTDLDNISSVVLTIEGESGGLSYVDISVPLTAESVALG